MKPSNLLFILPDQFSRDMSGCYGNPICKTPNLDALAESGVRFNNAISTSPICIPARASLATGRYVHEIRNWDNAHPYKGSTRSWHHRLREEGHTVDAIGKLHFRSEQDDNGFNNQINTMHMVAGTNSIIQCLRNETGNLDKRTEAANAGSGDTSYLRYDIRNAEDACRWIEEHKNDTQPWALFVGFVTPHPPMIAPPDLFDYYLQQELPLPPQWEESDWPNHPAMDFLRRYFQFQNPINEEGVRRFIAAYYGLCTFTDQQLGKVLEAVDATGLSDSTRIVFTSDHGEDRGARGVFGKFNMHEESCAIPLVMSGPDIPSGKVIETPVSLVDCYPTVMDFFDIERDKEEENMPGTSLMKLLETPNNDRIVFSEYHAIGSNSGIFMLRNMEFKYIYHVDKEPQLFHIPSDPSEILNLSGRPEYKDTLSNFEKELRNLIDPEEIDGRAKSDQMALVEAAGGADKVRRGGTFQNTPIPGEDPEIYKLSAES